MMVKPGLKHKKCKIYLSFIFLFFRLFLLVYFFFIIVDFYYEPYSYPHPDICLIFVIDPYHMIHVAVFYPMIYVAVS